MPSERRLIPLREWQTSTVELSANELSELQSCGAELIVQPRGSGFYSVQPGSVVGAVSTPGLRVIIEPKFEIDRLFHLLGQARGVRFLLERTELNAYRDLTSGFVALFLSMLRRQLRRGLLKGYRTFEEALTTVRGRIRTADQLRRRFALPLPIEVTYDEYTEDVEENRVLKAALRRVGSLHIAHPELRARVAETLAALSLVTDVSYDRRNVPEFRYTRLTEPYRPILELARLILENSAVDLSAGSRPVSGLLFDMNQVFEEFVYESIRQRTAAHTSGDRWARGAALRLDEDAVLRPQPDLSWWRGDRCVFVGDAKYKLASDGKLADLYQLLAYCSAADLGEGLLVYAEQIGGSVRHAVVHDGPKLRVEAINVEAPIVDIEARCDELAEMVALMAERGTSHRYAAVAVV